jgi:hypothetical protein
MPVEIVAINPSAKRGGKKKGKKPMAGKKTKKKKETKKNPSVRSAARAVGRRSKERFLGMNLKGALCSAPPRAIGMFAAKWGAKKFPGVSGGSDREDWAFSNYLAGGATGFLAGFLAENFKKGAGQKVLEGAIDLLVYKMIQNEVIPKNEFLTEQFGDDEMVLLGEDGEPIVMLGEEEAEEGDLLLGENGEVYMMGADGYTRPIDESHRLIATELAQRALNARPAMGGALARPTPALGGALARPTPALGGDLERSTAELGSAQPYPPPAVDPYITAYAGRG